MQIEDEYPGQIREMIRIIQHDRPLALSKYASAEMMAEAMRPDSPHNHPVFDLLITLGAAYLRINPAQLMGALRGKRKQQQHDVRTQQATETKRQAEAAKRQVSEAKQKERDDLAAIKRQRAADAEAAKLKAAADKEDAKQKAADQRRMDTIDALNEVLGGVPTCEREYVDLWWAKRIGKMSFDRVFYDHQGHRLKAEQVLLDMHLTAADLNLVKPRGDLLAATNNDRALSERIIAERLGCIERVCDRVATLPAGIEPEAVLTTFEAVCGWYFKDPLFAAAAIKKLIWQIKRMLLDLPVAQRHMIVFLGEQNTGKSFLQRLICQAISEVTAEASLKDVLDERQMELPEYGAILLDELVSADRADAAALKNFVTGVDWARRPMRTNMIEKVKLRASLMGTSNHSLGKLIFDSTGMRRFVELEVRHRKEIEPFWEQIVGFNWMHLWQAVDITADDPLISEFGDILTEKQEQLRNADNTEMWLRQFTPTRLNCKAATHEHIEYYATELYTDFKLFEEQYDRGWRGTSLTRWGRDMKSLLDTGLMTPWSYYKYGPKTVYKVMLAEADQADDRVIRPPFFGRA